MKFWPEAEQPDRISGVPSRSSSKFRDIKFGDYLLLSNTFPFILPVDDM
jgi:hypothetical protein